MAKRRATATRPAPIKQGAGQTISLYNGGLDGLLNKLILLDATRTDHYGMYNDEFYCNIQNINHAVKMLQNGCQYLMEKYLDRKKVLNLKQSESTNQVYIPANEGLFFDIPAYLEGHPDHWINLENQPDQGTVKDLYINISTPNMMTEEQVFDKLINIVSYIDQQEAAGQRLNIYLFKSSIPHKKNIYKYSLDFSVKIKNDSEPVNLQQLVYLIATPIILRFVSFFLSLEYVGFQYKGAYVVNSGFETECMSKKDIVYIPSMYYDYYNKITDYSNIIEIYPHLNN